MNSEEILVRQCAEDLADSELDDLLEQSFGSYGGTNGIPAKYAFREVWELIRSL